MSAILNGQHLLTFMFMTLEIREITSSRSLDCNFLVWKHCSSLVDGYQHLGKIWCLHLLPRRWKHQHDTTQCFKLDNRSVNFHSYDNQKFHVRNLCWVCITCFYTNFAFQVSVETAVIAISPEYFMWC